MKNLGLIFSSVFVVFLASACAHHAQKSEGTNVAAQPAVQSGFAPVDGIQMYYEVHGAAREGQVPLMLIHGGGSTIESNFKDLLPLLVRDRQVIAIEEEGHGHTVATGRAFTFDNTADDVAGVLDFLQIAKADVLGFSNGGTSALKLAIRHQDKVNRLIIASANFRRDGMMKGFWEMMAKGSFASMPDELKEADRKINSDPKHQLALYEQDSKRMMGFKDVPDKEVSSVHVPTLVLVGDNDVVTVAHAKRLTELISGARLAVVPALHGTYFENSPMMKTLWSVTPQTTVSLLSNFLSQP